MKSDREGVIQVPNEVWWNTAAKQETGRPISSGSLNGIDPSAQRNLAVIRGKIAKVSPVKFVVGFSESDDINAFASLQNGQYYIVFTNGFMRQFGDDPDVIAAVFGHELGHHHLGHTQPDYAKNRDVAIGVASQALGAISSYFIPFSGLLVGNAVKGAGLSYNRDDERDADKFGMRLALKAGYSPCGSYRFAEKMNALGQGPALAFLSTHPGNDERLKNSQDLSQAEANSSCVQ
ncbi:M48 family metalloprotease [Polynucleobacter sp. AP-Kolm-20A-A1]|uniref:M48 family metalloprotease n=1 Tax=Polynucleobacter sp. AP-Kolm-20A-A1 TaxID=2081041 RepID=UPI001BFCF104|nr:M48 family metalloprotease [Polynucleobacter sp. AP-Kolm-20A-A1]QWE20058.1 M48 family metalloprotease [Polynucleobacter sp. AP-Kolm-20A-A1]